MIVWRTLGLGLGLLIGVCLVHGQEPVAAGQVKTSLLADRSAITPGGTVELAVVFEIPDGWHIYWRNRGEGGMETTLAWKLPDGFVLGPVRFPRPKRYIDATGAHTFILERRPVVLAELRAPSDIQAGQSVEIEVDARWAACKESCVLGAERLKLTLPVTADAEEAKLLHEDQFTFARGQVPLPMEEAAYLKRFEAKANVDRIQSGKKFEVAVVIEVADGFYLYAHEPLAQGLNPTDLFHDSVTGLVFDRPRFPPGQMIQSYGMTFSVYKDRAVVILPVEAHVLPAGEEVRIGGVLTYQACSEQTGQCMMPTAAEWSLTIPVADAGEAVRTANEELFRSTADYQAAGAGKGPDGRTPSSEAGQGFTLDSVVRTTARQREYPLAVWLIFAFLAGVILNITPCVLPVISIKVLSFVQQASESPARVFRLGLAFSLGMLAIYNVLAILATAAGLVWGQHFQSPTFTLVMASVIFVFGLSVYGVFTLGVPRAVGDLAGQAEGEGYLGSVAKGALATLMGTPCLGPFLGSVLVWLATQPPVLVFLIFNTIGLGMALPYILLTARPGWLRFVPKAGPWLETFKQAMAFLLMGTVIYLLGILNKQLGGSAVVWSLVLLMSLAIACWIIGRWLTAETSAGGRMIVLAVAVGVASLGGWVSYGRGFRPPSDSVLPWVPFSMEKLTELTAEGRTVFLDITADWCPNCKYNMEFVFHTEEVAEAIREYDVVPMLADWTGQDPTIGRLVNMLAPGGSVPLCAVFPAGRPDEPIVMLEIVTKRQVIEALRQGSGR
ncbi:MAG: hypothetical protein GXY44_05715 [Phycisphaerales bacterium]|nr:hypothetical protein [Phycisphaerales bacterium]